MEKNVVPSTSIGFLQRLLHLRPQFVEMHCSLDVVSHSAEMAELDLNDPLFKTDAFMVYGFKVLPCRRTRRHDWRECPFAHPGEVARRRDPRLYTYVGIICPDAKQSSPCPRGDNCPYTHSLFEYWLHPTRYKTEFCSRGRQCTRPFCFFAHSETEVRPVDTDALLAVAMSPQLEPQPLLQHQVQSTTPLTDAVVQAADLLQKTKFFQTPLKSQSLDHNMSLLPGNPTYSRLDESSTSVTPVSQSMSHGMEWGLMSNTSGLNQTFFSGEQLIPERDMSWDNKYRRYSMPDGRISATMTDELLSRLGVSYLQSAQRSYNQDCTGLLDRNHGFTNTAKDFRTTPFISLTPSQTLLQNPGRNCKSFDAALLEASMQSGESTITERGYSLPASLHMSSQKRNLYK